MLHSIEIGKKIAYYRQFLNISQNLLAKLLGVSVQAVSKWELGKSIPSLNNFTILSEIFGVKLDAFIDYRCKFDVLPGSKKGACFKGNKTIPFTNFKNTSKSYSSKKIVKNIYYLKEKQRNTILNDFTFKRLIYSECKYHNIKLNKCKCDGLIYVDNVYTNSFFNNCLIKHCQSKFNVWSGTANATTFICDIYTNDTLKDFTITNSQLSYSSYTNVIFIKVSIFDSSWHQTIFYNSLFKNCCFKRLQISECNFQKCTLTDCTFDKSTYDSFNKNGNKIIRPIVNNN